MIAGPGSNRSQFRFTLKAVAAPLSLRFVACFLSFLFCSDPAILQAQSTPNTTNQLATAPAAQSESQADTTKTIKYERDLTTEEIVTKREATADTLTFPGVPQVIYSPEQNELYRLMRELQINSHARFAISSQESADEWLLPTGAEGTDVWALAERYLDLPLSVYTPTADMMVQHQLNMTRSADAGNIGLPRATNMPGIQVPLSAIGAMLGFTKDVSPTIRYSVPFRTQVSIVIYSPQAKVIATLMDHKLEAGSYERTWNGRDDNGVQMPPGDYIGEVRIGKQAVMRKYIQLQ